MQITMRYLLLISILFSFSLYGGSENLVKKMKYETSYEKALKKAKELNKPLLMVVGQEGCPWCNKFEVKTLRNKKIDAKIQKDFIPITILRYKDKGKYPKQFETKGVPTVLFIDPKSQEAYYKSFGYKSKREYTTELDNALKIFNNNNKL